MKCQLLSLFIAAYAACAFPAPKATPQAFHIVGDLSTEFGKRDLDFSITRNELAECRRVTVIYARGTIELGNVGSITGPPFFDALEALLGEENVGVQGVDYPATIGGYLKGGDEGGAQRLADLTKQAVSQCPDTQIVLSGYSQGAQLVHLGEAQMAPETAARVAAVVSLMSTDVGMLLSISGALWRPKEGTAVGSHRL